MTGHLATGVLSARYSTRELQAAAAALVAREFSTTSDQTDENTARPSPSASPPPSGEPRAEAAGTNWDRPASTGLLVRVTAANAGAGASTIALALAQVAHSDESPVRLLDAAAPAWSGLIGATTTEMGAEQGWRRGNRSDGLVIHRLADPVPSPHLVPTPLECEPVNVTVLDLGWTPRELAAAGDCWLTQITPDIEVVVTRTGARALDQAEHLLSAHDLASTLLVTVGASRHLSRTFGSAGPQVRQLHESRRAISVPLMSGRTPPRLDLENLPPPLIRAAHRLMARIDHPTGHSSRTHSRI